MVIALIITIIRFFGWFGFYKFVPISFRLVPVVEPFALFAASIPHCPVLWVNNHDALGLDGVSLLIFSVPTLVAELPLTTFAPAVLHCTVSTLSFPSVFSTIEVFRPHPGSSGSSESLDRQFTGGPAPS